MSKFLKCSVLGIGLLAGSALAAHAQSVSSIPPAGTPSASVPTQPSVSTETIRPDPGGSVSIKGEHYQPSANAGSALVDHPYSGSIDKTSAGPKPN
jgi:hypothetical protein